MVDEGPGISGSSMAAAQDALFRAGFRNVAFLPGHEGEPISPRADVAHAWRHTPRFFGKLQALRWNGKSLQELLAQASIQFSSDGRSSLAGRQTEQASSLADVSAGLWRTYAFGDEADWPPVAPTLERSKHLWRDPLASSAVLFRSSGWPTFCIGTPGKALGKISRKPLWSERPGPCPRT